jgi:hypothetical protein
VGKWAHLGERIAALKMDESFALRDFSTAEKDIVRMRSAIGMLKVSRFCRFAVRTLPSGGIRIYRTGTWGSWLGAGELSANIPPFMVGTHARKNQVIRPAISYHGFLWDSSLHRQEVQAVKQCSMKGCVFPAITELCRNHELAFAIGVSMEDSTLDHSDVFKPWDPARPYSLAQISYEPKIDKLEATLRFVNQHKNLDQRHK